MKNFQPITPEIIEKLKAITGPTYVKTDRDLLLQYQTDYETNPAMFHVPDAAVLPANAEEIAAIVKLANEHDFPITVRSGGTSLADGAIPVCGGLVLCMDRLNKIIELNEEGMYMTVEAGVRTIDLQNEAKKVGSCMPATRRVLKAASSAATWQPMPAAFAPSVTASPATRSTAWKSSPRRATSSNAAASSKRVRQATTWNSSSSAAKEPWHHHQGDGKAHSPAAVSFRCPGRLHRSAQGPSHGAETDEAGIDPTSVEYMDNSYVRGCADYCHCKDMPHYEDGIYVIITVETFQEDELDTKMDTVCTICEESGAVNVLEADNRVWNMRRNCQTSVELQSKVFLTDDVVVPVHKIAGTIEKIMDIGQNYPFEVKINAHIGDGNLHIVLCKMDMSDEEWERNVEEFHQQVYAYAYSVGGRLAGEHGIGAKKLKYMEQFTPKGELTIMKTIKRALDPKGS